MRKVHLVLLVAVIAGLALAMPPASSAQIAVGISVHVGPPPLRVVAVQPMAPGPGYLWTPGYWAYGPDGYYWVDGAWVMPPEAGLLWTPGYWGWGDGAYVWHRGYWGPHVGFYGGINYGFGYFGSGFVGGHWDHDRFFYNTAVWRVNTRVVHNVYIDRDYRRDMRESRVSFNGGRGGIDARPSREERGWEHERHWDATPMQARHEEGFRGGDRGRDGARPFNPPDRGNDRGRGNENMGRGNDRGDRGNQNMGRGNDRGRGNQDTGRGNDRGNRGNQGMGRGSEGKGNNGRGEQGKPQGKPDHGDRGRGRG